MTEPVSDQTTRTGIHPALIAAFETCGFLVTDENLHLLTEQQVDQWEAAIDQWFTEHPGAPPL